MDGQAELIWVAGYITEINAPHRKLNSLSNETYALSLSSLEF